MASSPSYRIAKSWTQLKRRSTRGLLRNNTCRVGAKVKRAPTHLSLPQPGSSFHFSQHKLGTSCVPSAGD